jgi:hypothetical protein
MTGGESQLKQRGMLYLAFSGKLTPFLCADNFITFSNISKSSRNDQISTQIPIQWVPMFLLLWFKRSSHEGDYSLPCMEAKSVCNSTRTTKYVFKDFMKRLDIDILVSYFRHFMTVEVDLYNLRRFIILATEVDCLVPLYCVFITLK